MKYILVISLLILIPHLVFAGPTTPTGETGFYSIVPLPDLPITADTSLVDYINAVFRLAISGAAILGVLMIMYGGFEYMTKEVTGKKDGRDRIRSAVLGLVLLLISWLILNVINPDILNLNFLRSAGGESYGSRVGANVSPTTSNRRLDQTQSTFQYINTGDPAADVVSRDSFYTICARNYGPQYRSSTDCMDRDHGLFAPTRRGPGDSSIVCETGSSAIRWCYK